MLAQSPGQVYQRPFLTSLSICCCAGGGGTQQFVLAFADNIHSFSLFYSNNDVKFFFVILTLSIYLYQYATSEYWFCFINYNFRQCQRMGHLGPWKVACQARSHMTVMKFIYLVIYASSTVSRKIYRWLVFIQFPLTSVKDAPPKRLSKAVIELAM
jgi:hypothetical protein